MIHTTTSRRHRRLSGSVADLGVTSCGTVPSVSLRTCRSARTITSRSSGGCGPRAPTSASPVRRSGLPATSIDFASDLGIAKEQFGELRIRLRPARKHRFRIDYVPIQLLGPEGGRAPAGLPRHRVRHRGTSHVGRSPGRPGGSATSTTSCTAAADTSGSSSRRRYTDVEASLDAAGFGREFIRARGTDSGDRRACCGSIRLRALAVTGEVSYFRLPSDLLENFTGEYVDYDISGTLNFTEQIGAQVGYRSLNLNVTSDEDVADLKLEGPYFGRAAEVLGAATADASA